MFGATCLARTRLMNEALNSQALADILEQIHNAANCGDMSFLFNPPLLTGQRLALTHLGFMLYDVPIRGATGVSWNVKESL